MERRGLAVFGERIMVHRLGGGTITGRRRVPAGPRIRRNKKGAHSMFHIFTLQGKRIDSKLEHIPQNIKVDRIGKRRPERPA